MSITTNPIEKRFGPEFFKRVPRDPGVYWMLDARNKCLYVGQSKNLKQRISYLKKIGADNSSKWGFLAETHNILWEEVKGQTDIESLRKKIIKKLKPRYNPIVDAEYFYLGSRWEQGAVKFRFTTSMKNLEGMDIMPIIHESKPEARKVYSALMRALWVHLMRDPKMAYPPTLTKPQATPRFNFGEGFSVQRLADLKKDYMDFFLGQNENLLIRFCHLIEWAESLGASSFSKNWLLRDLALLSNYYQRLREIINVG